MLWMVGIGQQRLEKGCMYYSLKEVGGYWDVVIVSSSAPRARVFDT